MFDNCKSISDILEWNTNSIIDGSRMLDNCLSISTLPDLSKEKNNNKKEIFKSFSLLFDLLESSESNNSDNHIISFNDLY